MPHGDEHMMTCEPGRAMMTGSAARQMARSMNPASSMISRSMAQPRICFWLAGTDRICDPLVSTTRPLVSSVTTEAQHRPTRTRSTISAEEPLRRGLPGGDDQDHRAGLA